MSSVTFNIKNVKSAVLEIRGSCNDFGLFRDTGSSYSIGFKESPLFLMEFSLTDERLYIDTLPGSRKIYGEKTRFGTGQEQWLADSCCDDFSIFNHLPDGKYILVKTDRKLTAADRILMGNEWVDAGKNVFCFDGSDGNKISPVKQNSKHVAVKDYYSMVISTEPGALPCLNSPLLCVIIPEYGIVWEGAAGFIFFSFTDGKSNQYSGKDMILIIPCTNCFIINPFDNYQYGEKEIMKDIADFMEII